MAETTAIRMDFITFLIYFLLAYVIIRFLYRLVNPPTVVKKKKKKKSVLPPTKVVDDIVLGTVTSLHVYPIKSCKGIEVKEALIGKYGFQMDRLFVLARDDSSADVLSFVTLRNVPKMCLVRVAIEKDSICVSIEGKKEHGKLRFPIAQCPGSEEVMVRIWEDQLRCVAVSKEADEWFSKALEVPLRLLRLGPNYERPIPEQFYTPNCDGQTSLADGFPYLMTSTTSLQAVNELSSEHVEMERFRPNIVMETVSTVKPFEEDYYAELQIGSDTFYNLKCCSRCKVPRMSLVDGKESENQEPTRTLESMGHYSKDEAYFGINLGQREGQEGSKISVGQKVILKKRYTAPLQKMDPPKKLN